MKRVVMLMALLWPAMAAAQQAELPPTMPQSELPDLVIPKSNMPPVTPGTWMLLVVRVTGGLSQGSCEHERSAFEKLKNDLPEMMIWANCYGALPVPPPPAR